MKRNLMLAASPLVMALGLSNIASVSTQAADLGGNCCSDLEERIAELENTTARKGNRKVSLQISGWVNEAVFFWDDGKETNAYVGTNSLEQSRVKFDGTAKINSDVSAGYRLELGVWGADSKAFSQENTGSKNEVRVRHSVWYLSSKTYGKLWVGHTGSATYHLLDDADGTNTRNYSDFEAAGVYVGEFQTRSADGLGPKWVDIMNGFNNKSPGQNGRRNLVRYDTPELMGFVATVAWGEDDFFDAALKYKQKFGDLSLLANGGYGRSTQRSDVEKENRSCGPKYAVVDTPGTGGGDFCQWWGFGGTIKHMPTGLFAYGSYGAQQVDLQANPNPPNTKPGSDISSSAFIQFGIEQKWWSIGQSTLFGEYRHDDVGQSKAGQESNLNFWSGGIVQNIDAAAIDLYLMYRHADGNYATLTSPTKVDLDALDIVITGARIQF